MRADGKHEALSLGIGQSACWDATGRCLVAAGLFPGATAPAQLFFERLPVPLEAIDGGAAAAPVGPVVADLDD